MAKGKWPHGLSTSERVERARTIISTQIDDLRELIAISEANRVIIYSPVLASQIPKSFAANAFNQFQWCSLNYEILRACSLWDNPREDRASIPTLVALVNDAACRAQIESDLGGGHYAAGHIHRFDRAIRIAGAIATSKFKTALYDFRNRSLAHSLVFHAPAAPVVLPKYGYERRLLRASIAVVSNFNNAVRDSSFAFDMAVEQSRRNARALWTNCTFTVPE